MRLLLLLISIAIGSISVSHAQTLTYRLLSGSSITPLVFGQPGTTEALTGSFTWTLSSLSPNPATFSPTFLDFESTSFSLHLDPSNHVTSSVDSSTGDTLFNALVDNLNTTSNPFFLLSESPGSYHGTFPNISLLIYANIELDPEEGGSFVASLNLVAGLVPEPSSWKLLCLGLGALLFLSPVRRRRTGGHETSAKGFL